MLQKFSYKYLLYIRETKRYETEIRVSIDKVIIQCLLADKMSFKAILLFFSFISVESVQQLLTLLDDMSNLHI